MDRIQVQASKLWDLLFDDETAATYQKTLNLTGTILKEFAQLIWLTLISVFVFGAWFSDTSVKAGKSIRDWVDNKGSDLLIADGKPAGETSQDLLEKGRISINELLNQAREQLGLEPQEIKLKSAAKPSNSAIKPANTPTAKAAPMDAQKPPVSAQPSAAAAQVSKPSAAPTTASAAASSTSETSREEVDSDWPPQEAD